MLPPPESFGLRSISAASAGKLGGDPTYLFVRTEVDRDTLRLETTVASAENRAATPREVRQVSKNELEQVLDLLKELQRDFRLTYLFVAHNLDVVRNFCDRVAVMRRGKIVELAPTPRLFAAPEHPYTKILLSAVPSPDPDVPMNFDVGDELARLDAG